MSCNPEHTSFVLVNMKGLKVHFQEFSNLIICQLFEYDHSLSFWTMVWIVNILEEGDYLEDKKNVRLLARLGRSDWLDIEIFLDKNHKNKHLLLTFSYK